MDFTSRGVRPSPPNAPEAGETPGANHNTSPKNKAGKFKKLKGGPWLNVAYMALLFSITIVLVAVVLKITISEASREERYVDASKMQAVFLNNGQVYFGDITELNSQYLNLANIYYLRVNQQVQPGQQASQNDVSLVKLGCELHGPIDLMTVNREQVTFWENLKDDGQVVKAVAEYAKQNPNGQNCEQQAQQQRSNTNSSSERNSSSPNNAPNSTNSTPGNNSPGNTGSQTNTPPQNNNSQDSN